MAHDQAGARLAIPSPLLLVLAVSATILAQEVALLRVLAIAHWHHAAQMIIAVALCGFGAAASLLAVRPALKRAVIAYRAAAAYAVSIPVSLGVASALEFNALAVGWESSQWLRLFVLQAIFVGSILLGALAIQICLALSAAQVGRTYAVNLVGSGAGALGVLPLLGLGAPEQVLAWLALLPALAAFAGARFASLAAVAVVLAMPRVEFEMTAYKALPLARLLPDSTLLETRYRAHARIDLLSAPSLRPVEGLSLHSTAIVAALTLITVDGSAAGVRADGDPAFFRDTLAATPLAFLHAPDALVLGEAGNLHESVLGERNVKRVDIAWTGENPRQFLARTQRRYDIVWLRLPQSVAMSENALATREAIAAALRVTTERGVVFISVPIHAPPREGLKAIATALAVTPHVEVVRSLDLLGIMLRRQAFDPSTIASITAYCRTRGFDRIGDPSPVHHGGQGDYTRLLNGESLGSRYRIEPATDDKPYFHRFMKWTGLGDGLTAADALQTAHLDWGTRVALVATVQVTVLGAALLLVPLLALHGSRSPPRERRFALWHFLAIGCAYASIEMAFLGRLTVLLGRPEYAVGIVLCAFLVASGLGSLSGARIRWGAWLAGALALASIGVLDKVQSLPAAVLLAMLVALPMGVPFPAGLRRLDTRARALVPWALAANGCASVATFSAAPLLASDIGYSGLIAGGALLYLLVGAADRDREVSCR